MLEGLAAWVLNSYLSRYVENLNTDQLSVGLLNGNVELEGLPLKREALAALDLPIEVKAGFVGKIRLHIPLTCLRSEPWTISMEQLYLVAGPIPPDDFDEEREDQAVRNCKVAQLDRMEAKWRSEHEAKQGASYYASSYTSWVSYGTSVVSSILENVQVKITDVHIRFEDDIADPKRPLAWGIMLDSLILQSSNEQWIPQFMSSTNGTKFKLVQLQRLSVYWDVAEDVTLIGGLELSEMAEAMRRMGESDHRHNYVVEPVSFEARLRRNASASVLQSRSSPRFACDFILDKLPVFLSDEQYESMVVWIYEFDRLGRARHFQRWRPKVAIHEHARDWWRFAAKSHIYEYRRRHENRNWTFVLQRAINNVLYVKAYTEHLINPVTCPAALKNQKEAMEQEVPFEELKLLREIAMERILSSEEETRVKKQETVHRANGAGMLQRWFPLWAGWYPAATAENQDDVAASISIDSRKDDCENVPKQQLEDEILDVLNDIEDNGVFSKDAIFATVNFGLNTGTFTLCSSNRRNNGQSESIQKDSAASCNTLFELAFSDVRFLMELRPRTFSSLYQLCLGTLNLRDKSMDGSLFPTLIEPQMRETLKPVITRPNVPVSLVSKYLPKFPWSSVSSNASSGNSRDRVADKPKDEPLFHVTYETKPRRSTADFKLHVKSRSLDIVYNESSLKRLVGFFTWPYQTTLHGLWKSSYGNVERQPLVTVAKNRYEELKRQTQKEIRKNWDQILDGKQKFTQRWDIDLDISAPQIILPENFFTQDTTIVVCDFGRFQFRTSSSTMHIEQPSQESDDEEDFKTPCSTPPDDKDESASLTTNEAPSHCDITEAALHQRMYDSYSLDLRDLRVLVYKAKNDWKSAYHQATTTMHLVDRFSVSLLLERRVIHTLDHQWPSATLSGSLPKLVVHMNEHKLQALKVWHKLLNTSTASWIHPPSPVNTPLHQTSMHASFNDDSQSDCDTTPIEESRPESRLLVMQFTVGQMCLDLQSRGQSVAELQVTGIQSTFTMRPHDTVVSLTVHGLLLVDALQTFGPDFELLVASHRNVSIDSVSGSLLDSELNSPTSPASPSAESLAQVGTSMSAINAALKHLHQFDCAKSPPNLRSVRVNSWPSSVSEGCESEALIAVDFVTYHSPKIGAFAGPSSVASVHFNNLDIIANQRTIVELVGFVRQAFPEGISAVSSDSDHRHGGVREEQMSNAEATHVEQTVEDESAVRLQLTFDFHRLSVLFLKSLSIGDVNVAQKVATATMTGACIRASIGSTLEVNGSLGSVQVLDLVLEGAKHSRIMSVGRDCLFDTETYVSAQSELYKSAQQASYPQRQPPDQEPLEKAFMFKVFKDNHEDTVSLVVRMASVRYVHSTRFLVDLSSCASEFSHYMADLASSVKNAAAEVAELCLEVDVKLDVILESPVIVLPESSLNDNVLIAHLGRISIDNSAESDWDDVTFNEIVKNERITVEIRDMSLFSRDGSSTTVSHKAVDDADFRGFPILHKTVLVLTIDRLRGTVASESQTMLLHDPPLSIDSHQSFHQKIQSLFKIYGRIVSPLKVSLSKKQYEQILKTVESTTDVNYNNVAVAASTSVCTTDDRSNVDQSAVERTTTVDGSSTTYALKAKFELPKLTVILFGDLAEMERPLVSLSFQEFLVDYEKQLPFMSSATVTLRTLIMEDLLEDPDSKHRFLMLSSAPKQNKRRKLDAKKTRHFSSSCPDVSFHQLDGDVLPRQFSLPDRLNTENVFQNMHRMREKRLFGGCVHVRRQVDDYDRECPRTPPPSPLPAHHHQLLHHRTDQLNNAPVATDALDSDALVTVKVLTADSDQPNERFKRYVDVNFNCLDTIVNLHSWVVVLDFFGIGESSTSSTVNDDTCHSAREATSTVTTAAAQDSTHMTTMTTTEMEIEVRSLTLVFNKEEYELAKANVSNFVARILHTSDHVSVKGKLGSMSLLDLTPNGHLYREKFTMVGDEALDFQIVKYYDRNYGCSTLDDFRGDQHYDAKIKLTMSSVHYVHTNRFSSEICAFFLHFHQMQNLMAQFRADATGVPSVAAADDVGTAAAALMTQASVRVKLDIHVSSPVIVVPISSSSSKVLVVDLGRMSLNNEFLHAGADGTISVIHNQHAHTFNPDSTNIDAQVEDDNVSEMMIMTRAIYGGANVGPCVLDVIHIHLVDMDLCLAERLERDHARADATAAAAAVNDLKFMSFVVRKKSGSLLTTKCKLNLQMERNLHYAFDHSVADVSVRGTLSTVHCMLDLHQYKVIRGILKYNLGEALEEFNLPEERTTTTVYRSAGDDSTVSSSLINIHHHQRSPNVSNKSWTQLSLHLDLVNVIVEVHQRHASPPHRSAKPLAKVNLFKSKLTYERYANSCVDVDLVSQEILVSDIRDCALTSDGSPRRPNIYTNILEPTKGSQPDLLQAEIHFRMTGELTRATVLLNNMRVIAVIDWWTSVLDFVCTDVDNFHQGVSGGSEAQNSLSQGAVAMTTVSDGVVTKRGGPTTLVGGINFGVAGGGGGGSAGGGGVSPFELKINVTETGIVVIEDLSSSDTDAVMLKATAVVLYRPGAPDKPLSCSLQRLEVFSCVLGLEEETALSIVDPVTVTVELLVKRSQDSSRGLLDSMEAHHTLEVSMQDLNVRLSYHDMQLFVRLLDSLPKQAPFLSGGGGVNSENEDLECDHNRLNFDVSQSVKRLSSQIAKLEVLGFRQGDCLRALEACNEKLDDAALWLTLHASPLSPPGAATSTAVGEEITYSCDVLGIRDLEIHVNHFSLCLIDDCRDADVPLLELTLNDLGLHQSLGCHRTNKGKAQFLVQGDFYNRNLSGWEPFLEPWRCSLTWRKVTSVYSPKVCTLSVEIAGRDVLDVNVTSTLLDLCRNVKANWTEDYYRIDGATGGGSGNRDRRHRRSPFVPFALKNETGSDLRFATVTSNHEQLTNEVDFFEGGGGYGSLLSKQAKRNWTDVAPGEVAPFTFEGRMRSRHRDTHDFKVHQLIVCIEGWQQVAPVSVDKVGVFFRHAESATTSRSSLSARIVFAVTLEGSAQKLVTIRSALTFSNQLDVPIEVRLENSMLRVGATLVVTVQPRYVYPIPLTFVSAHIFARPVSEPPLLYCNSAIQWQQFDRPGEIHETKYSCTPTSTRPNVRHFRFCARVRRENYPIVQPQQPSSTMMLKSSIAAHYNNVGHHITVIPPVVLENLLPCELTYEVRSCRGMCGNIKEGRQANLHFVDLSETFYLILLFDNFRVVNDLVVPNGSTGFVAVLQARDVRGRTLLLQVRATGHSLGTSIRISISAPYWLVNKTGLPLIIRQEGVGEAAAGQFAEHEMARSVAPLLFSFSDIEAPALCSMRLGRSVHEAFGGEPQWCHHFHLQPSTTCVRRLHVSSTAADAYVATGGTGGHRPDWVYGIGIDVRRGGGRYSDVHIVTFTPRFQLDNCSSHRLEYAQKYALEAGSSSIELDSVRLSAMPRCSLPFHWPRPDRDQLLCVRMASTVGCCWSGGFAIERVDSFHVNMRDANGVPRFVRVQVVMQGATYVVVFADVDATTPSPLRLDNLSEVPVTCHQSGVENVERLRLCLRPRTSVAYAWDEPTLPPFITCLAPGGCWASYSLSALGESKKHLSYENFIYIAFSETFGVSNGASVARFGSDGHETRELVLDVPQGNKVILTRKELGRRSQLWRMTSDGMLQHEGSSPPTRGGTRRTTMMSSVDNLVLDIEDMAPRPREFVRLVLRKSDKRRALTQTWEFTGDGRLCCKLTTNSLFVQPRDGFYGLRCGTEVVLGPFQPVQYMLTKTGIPVEQVVGRQRLWSGSGLLGVKVITDGPTRVLQITDIGQKDVNDSDLKRFSLDSTDVNVAARKIFQLQVVTRLPGGLGLSLVNHSPIPEELVYVRLTNIVLEVSRSSSEDKLDGTVECVQVDNQLTDAECPVLLFVSPPPGQGGRREEELAADHQPAVHFTVHRLSRHSNIDIFKNLIVNVKNLTLQVEERLLWKLCQFCDLFGVGELDDQAHLAATDSNGERRSGGGEVARRTAGVSVALARRYYFDLLRLSLRQARLSVITSRDLSVELRAIKRRSGLLTLIRFEDALVELDPFVKTHTFETGQFLVDAILQHYRDELKSQAAKILGAVDFLGNPLGLVNDVSEGLSGFLIEGNVGGLLKNVTHGLSNSAAKVTGTLSDGLGSVTMDARHREQRRRLQQSTEGGGGSERLVAGLKGLGFGLYGGVTSLVVQTYEGAANDGVTGIITGFGKGLIGTITKPAVGMLDLATSAASAVRDTSRSSHHQVPSRIRMRRVCVGPTGLLPQYSLEKSRGQELLYSLNDKDYGEVFIGCEPLGYSRDALYAVISFRKVYFLSQSLSAATTTMTSTQFSTSECVLTIPLSDLYHCKVVKEIAGLNATCLELTTKVAGMTPGSTSVFYSRPKVVCDTEAIALKVARQINYAKRMRDELVHTLVTPSISDSTNDGY